MDKVVIVESRVKVAGLLALALGFAAIYWLLPDPHHQLPGWGGWFFALCAAVFVVLLLRPRTLILDPEGFSVTGGLVRNPTKTRWVDVATFFPVSIRRGARMVGYIYSDSATKPKGAAVAKLVSKAEGGISGAWPCSTSALADLLNEYHQRALSGR